MLNHMFYDEKFEKVFSTLFKNHVLVKDLETGSRVSKNENFDCVTLEGSAARL